MDPAILDTFRIITALLIVIPAAVQDWKERKASDRYWIAGGIVAFILMEMEMLSSPLFYHLFVLAIAWIYFDIFWNGEEIFGENGVNLKGANALRLSAYIMASVVFILGIYFFHRDMLFCSLISVLAMIFLFYLLYMFDIIKGGADAKALIFLSILFPHYPAVSLLSEKLPFISAMMSGSFSGVLTWEQIFLPFSFILFMTAALISLTVPLSLLIFNLLKGDIEFPQALFGYRMPLSEIKRHHVWLMERVVDGRIKISLFPEEDEDAQVPLLRDMGVKDVWVNPKIPFLIPVSVALILSLLLGDLFLAIIKLI